MMTRRSLSLAALAMLSTSAASAADLPCCRVAAPVVLLEMPRIYIVDQGPVYSGPGIYTNPTVVLPWRMAHYPYVGRGYPSYRPQVAPLRVRAQGE
jgi:hypothetical protein